MAITIPHYLDYSGLKYFYNNKILKGNFALKSDIGTLATKNVISLNDLDTDFTNYLDTTDTKITTINSKLIETVKVGTGTTNYLSGTTITLPAYPTSLPASDVSEWAKASSKPTYTKEEVGVGSISSTEIQTICTVIS